MKNLGPHKIINEVKVQNNECVKVEEERNN